MEKQRGVRGRVKEVRGRKKTGRDLRLCIGI